MLLPIGIPFTVTCYAQRVVIGWRAFYEDGSVVTVEEVTGTHQLGPEIVFTLNNRTSQLTLNVRNNSLTAVECIGTKIVNQLIGKSTFRVNLMFYGKSVYSAC